MKTRKVTIPPKPPATTPGDGLPRERRKLSLNFGGPPGAGGDDPR